MAETLVLLANLLVVLLISAIVRAVLNHLPNISYSVVLVLVGLLVSVSGISLGVPLTSDIILFVILPAILFYGTISMDTSLFSQNIFVPILLVLVGLPFGIALLGGIGVYAFGFPLIIGLLFAAMIYPVDPAAVLSLYHELDAPERLVVLSEGESVLDDGLAIVIFATVLGIVHQQLESGRSLSLIVDAERVGEFLLDLAVTSVGGVLVGAGIALFGIAVTILFVDERMAELLFTFFLAFGSFYVAEHYLHVSGVLATVTAGLLAGTVGREKAHSVEIHEFLEDVWEAAEFIMRTLLYILIGSAVPFGNLIRYIDLVVIALVLVLGVRAVVVYSLVGVANRLISDAVPRNYQHILVWGSLHTSISIALVLSLGSDVPYVVQLRTMVFGVATLGAIIQGLLMPVVLESTGVVESDWL